MDEQLATCVQAIKSRLPLGTLLPLYGFPPPRNERRYRSVCWLHGGDNRSAFAANLRDNVWYCHSRGHGGDQITLIMEARQCSFREAVEWAAERVGVELPTNGRKQSSTSAAMLRLRRRLRDTALAELAAEDAQWREIEEGLYALLRAWGQRLYSKPKQEWTARNYTDCLLLDECGDELDGLVRERQTRFDEERRQVNARYA